jgi:hypothetical protein
LKRSDRHQNVSRRSLSSCIVAVEEVAYQRHPTLKAAGASSDVCWLVLVNTATSGPSLQQHVTVLLSSIQVAAIGL